MKKSIQFILNDRITTAVAQSNQSLLEFLRNVKCLKGAKPGCLTGDCGACTVLLDGRCIRSCVFPLEKVEGHSITTIEGLEAEGSLHPIQQAFIDSGAIQCGYCTPGMILATKALLDRIHHPDDAEIRKALAGNYCRCTGYAKIIKAVRLCSAWLYPDEAVRETDDIEETTILKADSKTYSYIGKRQVDIDSIAKATGRLAFADDIDDSDCFFLKPVWADIPHARILKIDTDVAAHMPGVMAVFTADNIPGTNGFGMVDADQKLICSNEIAFYKDVVAAVVAGTKEEAEAASATVETELEALPAVTSMDDDNAGIIRRIKHEKGDVEAARNRSGLLVLRDNYSTGLVEHGYLECECAVADFDGKMLTVLTPTQAPFELRRQIAAATGLPEEQVLIRVTPLGGGFGGKGDATIQPIVAVAAFLLHHKVKCTLTRVESTGMSTKRHPYSMDYEIGFEKDGTIEYVDADIRSDGGAYANLSPRVIDQSCIFALGPYKVADARVVGTCYRTNNVLSSAFRGFGINQVSFAVESMLDEAARHLGLDPFEIRLVNALDEGDETFSGEILGTSVGLRRSIEECRKKLYEVIAGLPPEKEGHLRGIGMACAYKNVGAGKGRADNAGAKIIKNSEDSYTLFVSGVDMGQGFRTAMGEIAAEVLGISPSTIDVRNGDTGTTARHGSAVGERQTLISGKAVEKACLGLKEKLDSWDGTYPVEYECLHEGPKTYSLGDEEAKKTVPKSEYRNYPAYAYCTHAVIIEIEKDTGKTVVTDVIAVHDAGRVINRTVLEGQIEGSCLMGIGYALSEHFDVADGIPKARRYKDLGIPTIMATPRYHIVFLEDPLPEGPFGAKGISEIGTVPMTAAITNAICDATGIRFRSIPVTARMMQDALSRRHSEKSF